MARFDVYSNRARNRESSPYVVDIQASTVNFVGTRVVILLTRIDRMGLSSGATALFPVFVILDNRLFLHTSELSSLSIRHFGRPVASLQLAQHRITSALDFLFNGY